MYWTFNRSQNELILPFLHHVDRICILTMSVFKNNWYFCIQQSPCLARVETTYLLWIPYFPAGVNSHIYINCLTVLLFIVPSIPLEFRFCFYFCTFTSSKSSPTLFLSVAFHASTILLYVLTLSHFMFYRQRTSFAFGRLIATNYIRLAHLFRTWRKIVLKCNKRDRLSAIYLQKTSCNHFLFIF